ncbi:MAG: hypothetical protein HGA26_04720 [Chlorobiaceae bacterium]|nr:hypothetical protein [Chlorobiaceae bacterium]
MFYRNSVRFLVHEHKVALMKNGNIDIHFHLFNGRSAFEELLEIGWRLIHDDYPYKESGMLFNSSNSGGLSAWIYF